MIEFLILVLFMAVAWLIYNLLELRDRAACFDAQSAELFRRLATLEADLQKLHQESPRAMEGPTPLAPAPKTADQQQVDQLPVAPEVPATAIIPHALEVPEWSLTQRPASSPVTLSTEGIGAEAATAVAASAKISEEAGRDALFTPTVPHAPARIAEPKINWERFLGVNLFAWVGGLALFLGVAFFIKYAFDHDLISPAMRVAMGFAVGLGILVTGLRLSRERYAATVQTLCASGILILYADVFASYAFYHFIGILPAIALMSLVTTTAFLLVVRLDAPVIAILGLLGGFLTPPLLSSGEDRPLGLFTYVALLDTGLIAIALHRRWDYLVLLAGLATLGMEFGWSLKFFSIEKVETAMIILAAFSFYYLGAWRLFRRRGVSWGPSTYALLLQWAASLLFAFALLARPYPEVASDRPGLIFGFVFLIDAMILWMAYSDLALRFLQHAAGAAGFLLLTVWTAESMTEDLIYWALGFYLLFAIMHSAVPVVFERWKPGGPSMRWAHIFPPVAVLLTLIPLLTASVPSVFFWLAMILLSLIGLGLTLVTGYLIPFTLMLVLTLLTLGVWVMEGAVGGAIPLEQFLLPLGALSLLFFVAGIFLTRRMVHEPDEKADFEDFQDAVFPGLNSPALIPIFSAALPFLLLAQIAGLLQVSDPSPIFGLGLVFMILLLGLVKYIPNLQSLCMGALAGVLLVEYVWHFSNFEPEIALTPLLWYLLFPVLLGLFPFLFSDSCRDGLAPWLASALGGPLHFYLVYQAVNKGYPNPYMGVLPAAFAVVSLYGCVRLLRMLKRDDPRRLTLLALFGGVCLFFVTLIIPIQLEKQWITIGWALEGLALIWLMRRIPHEGLRITGVGLLAVAFVRLALNLLIFEYYARSAIPIFNWYLYSFGIVSACLIMGARILPPAPATSVRQAFGPMLYAGGGLLAFMLLNIEIADYFSEGERLRFEFSGDFARDMTYSLAWGLFAFTVMIIGIRCKAVGARYAGMGFWR